MNLLMKEKKSAAAMSNLGAVKKNQIQAQAILF